MASLLLDTECEQQHISDLLDVVDDDSCRAPKLYHSAGSLNDNARRSHAPASTNRYVNLGQLIAEKMQVSRRKLTGN